MLAFQAGSQYPVGSLFPSSKDVMKKLTWLLYSFILSAVVACSPSDVKEAADVGQGVPRKTLDKDTLGLNAFANDARFGSQPSQFEDIKSNLKLNFVRVLIAWDSNAHPSKGTPPNFGFADSVINSIPAGVDALLVLTGTPSWMNNSANWTAGDPRRTFVEEWVRPVVERYGENPKVIGFQIWNEPNQSRSDNSIMGFSASASRYVDALRQSAEVIRAVSPSKLIVSAATTAINQNYPSSLSYNRAMRDAGAQSFADIWAIHYYGKQYENVIRPGGVRDFANGLSLPIWVTESGAQGVNSQLAYGEEVWPFLKEKIPGIERIYVYQYTEATPASVTYGLRNLTAGSSLSDLYIWLRDN